MTFFQRLRTPFGDSQADEDARYQPRVRLVGDVLRERREELGLDLDEIGEMLRIKPAYLGSLEQGRTHDLPGPTYAIGFVRAYAEFLGMDAEPLLARFKAEASGVTARPDLTLPVPLGERSLPGGALVLMALILALCGYGVWYYLSTEERGRPERVAAVPAALQPPVPVLVAPPSPTGSAAPTTLSPSASAPASDNVENPQPVPSLFGAAAGPTPPPSAAPAAPVPSAAVAPSAATTASRSAEANPTIPSPPATNVAVANPAANPPPAAPASATTLAPGTLITAMPRTGAAASAAPTPPAPVQPSAPPSPAPSTAAAPAAPPSSPIVAAPPASASQVSPAPATQTAAVAPAAAAPPPAPNATAGAAQPARVSIRATADCWIQVRAADQSIVFSKVLKSGETYNVPAKPGLSLRTGNAGVLEIAVDGKTAPSIGGIGALRRDVSLDPSELAAGTAVHG